ncbi:hypothetical protein OYE22_28530 [Streptomyces sp. 71268]|nr:hypothetical protein [Streptomyces sp. 71268]WEV28689.1 hypothetical protein OYE22_28530 [Streptomyces sp. 71268]
MAAEHPVIVQPYDAAAWDGFYQAHLNLIQNPACRSCTGCAIHER